MTESIAGTYRADLGDLATLGPVKFNDKLTGLLTTAHPTLMEDGSLINLINGVGLHLLVSAGLVFMLSCMHLSSDAWIKRPIWRVSRCLAIGEKVLTAS